MGRWVRPHRGTLYAGIFQHDQMCVFAASKAAPGAGGGAAIPLGMAGPALRRWAVGGGHVTPRRLGALIQ
ncbi:MAG: hypothetical protein ACRDOU_31585, partial [Streptosporangiaceae bacterium]